MNVSEYFEEGTRRRAEALAEAERRAAETGKERFDLARLEQLLNRGPQAARGEGHRVAYYLFREEVRTLAEYAQQLIDNEPWEDAR